MQQSWEEVQTESVTHRRTRPAIFYWVGRVIKGVRYKQAGEAYKSFCFELARYYRGMRLFHYGNG